MQTLEKENLMQELPEPIQSVLRSYCHVEWYEVSELADDLRTGRHKLDSDLWRQKPPNSKPKPTAVRGQRLWFCFGSGTFRSSIEGDAASSTKLEGSYYLQREQINDDKCYQAW